MICGHEDIAEDFTNLKREDGAQAYHSELVACAMRCYRMYQRQLWDPAGGGKLPEHDRPVEEWQFRMFGSLGVFLLDVRGSQVTGTGRVVDGPLLSERQRHAFQAALSTRELQGLIVGSETPFVDISPEQARMKATTSPLSASAKESWPYNTEELIWVLECIFDWREAEEGREVLLLTGGSGCAVKSTIHDRKTAVSIRHIATSPLTSCTHPFTADFAGEISNRFTYSHSPLQQHRNYCTVDVKFMENKCVMNAELVVFNAKASSHKERRPAKISLKKKSYSQGKPASA